MNQGKTCGENKLIVECRLVSRIPIKGYAIAIALRSYWKRWNKRKVPIVLQVTCLFYLKRLYNETCDTTGLQALPFIVCFKNFLPYCIAFVRCQVLTGRSGTSVVTNCALCYSQLAERVYEL